MKSIVNFWKKDLINKLILLTLLAIIAGVFALIFLITNMPDRREFSEVFSDFLPPKSTPTFVNRAIQSTVTKPSISTTATPFLLPTNVPPMRTQIIPIEYPTATLELPTPLPTISTPESTGTSGQTLLAQFPCIPNQTPETGRVLDVVDGNTIKVLIKELMYVVRYIGVNVPMDGDIKEPFGKTATHFNAQLVYGKDIILVKDVNNKDDRGRLLRYVIVGNTLVNFELIRAGYGVAKDTPPDSACVDTFTRAEQEARQALVGQWSGTPMP